MSDPTQQGHVTSETTDGLCRIEFFHPLSNSLPGNLLKKLADSITEAGENDEVKVIVLQSAGERAFCAGASFDELSSIEDLETGKKFFSGFANVINAMRKCPKIVIGRIQGKAVGGGVGLASATDYCFATKYASVKLSELAVGIGPFVIAPSVERKIGISAMSELAINATEWRDAEWARAKGLYNEVFEEAAKMDEAIQTIVSKLKNSNPEALEGLKKIFWESTGDWDALLAERAAISGKLVMSDFTKNAIAAFKKK